MTRHLATDAALFVVSALSVLASLMSAGRAAELTEVRISQVTCGSLRATQTGLPPRTTLEVEVINPDTVTTLKTVTVTTDRRGRLDTRIAVSLVGLSRVLVEVIRSEDQGTEVEYGEEGIDLRLPCTPPTTSSINDARSRPTGTELGRPPTTRQGAAAAPGSTPKAASWAPAVAGGAVLLVILAAILRAGHNS
jgi:hypothetical protein